MLLSLYILLTSDNIQTKLQIWVWCWLLISLHTDLFMVFGQELSSWEIMYEKKIIKDNKFKKFCLRLNTSQNMKCS